MRKTLGVLVTAFALMSWAVPSQAELIFSANLTIGQEPDPPGVALTTIGGDPRPTPFGRGTFVLNDDETSLTMDVEIFNIDFTENQTSDPNDNLLNAHIHVLPTSGALTGPVRWGFIGNPFNDTVIPNVLVTPFASGVGGRVTGAWDTTEGNGGATLFSELPAIKDGLAYINFHTVQNPGGEVRGQILQVPEPGSMLLVGLGFAALFAWRSRRA